MEELVKNNNQVYGFYDPVGIDSEDSLMLQVVYLLDGKYYVMYHGRDLYSEVMFQLDIISDMYKDDKEKLNYAVSEFMSHFKETIPNETKYELHEVNINDIHHLIPYQEGKALISADFSMDSINGAVVLSDGRVAVGDLEFLEKAIMENVIDQRYKYELLENIYYNFYSFEKRANIINDFCSTYEDTFDDFERKLWDDKRTNNNMILYALSLLDSLNVSFKEINDARLVENKRVL